MKDIFAVAPVIGGMAPDLITGGPPCQDYSVAGKRVEGENASLTGAFAMLVCLARPQWFAMENVPQAARSEAWTNGRKMLVRAGYGLSECKLDASWYGVPQLRKRLFVIGRIGERHGFLDSSLVKARSERQTVISDVLDILEGWVYARPFRAERGVRSIHEPFPNRDAHSPGTADGLLSEQPPSCRSGSSFAGSDADDTTSGDATGFPERLAVEGRNATGRSSNDC
ncbi:DNA cytosine methyltransferase [Brucella abortus]|uniref:DNA cytosine methyltransferase n=1 Tax=Brucella abortus TaxID=235 RepID=UPI00039CC963|nr:DNA cytosine methyltransferase [Brucella abortus]